MDAISSLPTPIPPAPVENKAPPSSSPVAPEPTLPWSRSAQWTVAVLLGVVLLLFGRQLLRGGGQASQHEPAGLVDVNSASRADLVQVPGIGPALADRILAYRQAHGPFPSIEALEKVRGLGPRTLARLRPFLVAETVKPPVPNSPPVVRVSTPPPQDSFPRNTRGKKEEKLAGQTININEADVTELKRLPGIGPTLSQRIVDERARRPFASANELRRVKGIGPKTLEKLRPFVTVGK